MTPIQAPEQSLAKLVENLILADRVMQSKGVIWGDRYEELSKPLRKARSELDAAISAHEAEVGRLRTELGKYANVFNWDVDGQGIRRVWLEPDSTSPTAYNGFESARAALTQGETK